MSIPLTLLSPIFVPILNLSHPSPSSSSNSLNVSPLPDALFCFMTVFDLPVWQRLHGDAGTGSIEDPLKDYYVVEQHILQVFKPDVKKPRHLHAATTFVDGYREYSGSNEALYYPKIGVSRLQLPDYEWRAKWGLENCVPTLISLAFIRYWTEELHRLLLNSIAHKTLQDIDPAALYLVVEWVQTHRTALTPELRAVLAAGWHQGTTWFNPTTRAEMKEWYAEEFWVWVEEIEERKKQKTSRALLLPTRPNLADDLPLSMPKAVTLASTHIALVVRKGEKKERPTAAAGDN